jgi:hypothetical protein
MSIAAVALVKDEGRAFIIKCPQFPRFEPRSPDVSEGRSLIVSNIF